MAESHKRNKVGAPALRYMLNERRVVFEIALCHLAPSVSKKLFLSLRRRRLGDRFDCMIGVGRDDLPLLPHHVRWVLALCTALMPRLTIFLNMMTPPSMLARCSR